MPIDHRDALAGGIWGLLVGDALGVPYEFQTDLERLAPELIDMPLPAGLSRSHPGAPREAWSDDGAHALCVLDSLLERGRLDLPDLGERLVRWFDHGYLAVNGVVFDVGAQTHRALDALRSGVPAHSAGPAGEWDNGNGSLMRVLPLALWHQGSDEELARDAGRQSLVTHGHPRAQVCCALYSGYVVDCLRSARLALREKTFEDVIRKAVSLGDDTDTTAAVAGGIAGVRHGMSGIPERWLGALAGRGLAEPLVARLLRSYGDRA